MTATALKADIRKRLDGVEDEKILKAIHTLLKEISQEENVGYTASGKPITIKKLQKHLDEAEEDIKMGRVYSSKEVKSHFQSKYGKK